MSSTEPCTMFRELENILRTSLRSRKSQGKPAAIILGSKTTSHLHATEISHVFHGFQKTPEFKTAYGCDGGLMSFLKKPTVFPLDDTMTLRTESISAVPVSSAIVEWLRQQDQATGISAQERK